MVVRVRDLITADRLAYEVSVHIPLENRRIAVSIRAGQGVAECVVGVGNDGGRVVDVCAGLAGPAAGRDFSNDPVAAVVFKDSRVAQIIGLRKEVTLQVIGIGRGPVERVSDGYETAQEVCLI